MAYIGFYHRDLFKYDKAVETFTQVTIADADLDFPQCKNLFDYLEATTAVLSLAEQENSPAQCIEMYERVMGKDKPEVWSHQFFIP